MDELELNVPISKYPKGYIPSGAKVITGIDRANGDYETYLVKGFIDTDGSIHIQSYFKYDIVTGKIIEQEL